jgi:hypothetical protein
MLFKFLQKPIVLDCFTTSEQLVNIAPINHAYKTYPEWWNNLPPHAEQDGIEFSNMRSCIGMTEFFKHSIHIPMWCDLFLEVLEDGGYRWQFSDPEKACSIHPKYQYGDFMEDGKSGHMKLKSPWLLRCKEDINWVWTQPTYNFPQIFNITVLPGIVEYKDNVTTNVNFVINTSVQGKILIPVGQPIVSLTPMSERKVEVKRHVISEAEEKRMYSMFESASFSNIARKVKRMKEANKGCPYSHYMEKK